MSVLITGGDGYIGSMIVERYLKNTEENIILWARAKDKNEELLKKEKISKNWSPETLKRVTIIFSDLREDGCFELINKENVTQILHTAAVIRFNVEEELANDINIKGTQKILKFAEKCPNLKSFDYLSTVYTSGRLAGEIKEEIFNEETDFVNHYERSKNKAELMIVKEFDHLPWQIIRIATVISDNNDGDVIQYNVFHNTMRLLYNGLISILPGDENTPLYLITGEFAADSIVEIMRNSKPKNIYHVCHTEEESASLKSLIDWGFEVFNEKEEFTKMKILKPLFADEKTFDVLAKNMKVLSAGVVADAISSITPFASQLYIKKTFKICNTKNSLKSYRAPNPESLIKNTARYLIRTKWGREK